MYHGMDIDWEKMEEVVRTSSAREVLIQNAEEKVLGAAVAWRENYEYRAETMAADDVLFFAIKELIALREGQ